MYSYQHKKARLPVGAEVREDLQAEIKRLTDALPASLQELLEWCAAWESDAAFDAARAEANHQLMLRLGDILNAEPPLRRALVRYAGRFMDLEEASPVLRVLARDVDMRVRRMAGTQIRRRRPADVALPATQDGPWDATGWLRGSERGRVTAHPQGTPRQEEVGVPTLRTVGELRALLGVASPAQLGWLLGGRGADEDGPYKLFQVPKREAGEVRLICAPNRILKAVQRRILEAILAPIPSHEAAHGFVPGRSTVTNAQAHVGQEVIVKFDLKDFFPSIHQSRVLGLFTSLGYTFGDGYARTDDDSNSVAPVLARLCVYRGARDEWGAGFAPQGAPTSPALSNLICRTLDARLTGLAHKLGGVYTRYADDLTLSFASLDELNLGRLRWWVDQICYQEGFLVHHKKFRVTRRSQRQQVTGIVVNDTPRVPREERRKLRAILHQCQKFGVAAQSKGDPRFLPWLRGYASYIHMVHPEEGLKFLEIIKTLELRADPAP